MKFVFLFTFIFLLNPFLFSTIIGIPADQPTIQQGIDASVNGDTVLVQPGTYLETINYNGKNITVASLFLTTQDTTYISQTIIDGNQDGSVVTFESGEDTTAVLTGFSITNGNSDDGGGIYIDDSSPTISYNQILNNSSVKGGGIYCRNSNSTFYELSVNDNISTIDQWDSGGGGFYGQSSLITIENSIFQNNTTAASGGGLYCMSSTVIMQDIEFVENSSHYEGYVSCDFGGGGMCFYGSDVVMENITVLNNSSESNGGGVCLNISDVVMKNVIISNNTTEFYGGGIYFDLSNSIFHNVIIANNTADIIGGGLRVCFSELVLNNVNVVDNISIQGGGIDFIATNSDITNCILTNNVPEEIYLSYDDYHPNILSISYTDIQGGEEGIEINDSGTVYWLEGNIDEDPLFVGTGEHPFSLLEDSPCIDAGTPDTTGLNLPPFDIIGKPRIFGDRIDMGAYEWQGTSIDQELSCAELVLLNFPNPFISSTTINFSVTQNSDFVSIEIFNIKGQKVRNLECVNSFDAKATESLYHIEWNGKDESGKHVNSGIYFYKLKSDGFESSVRKMVLLH